MTKFSEGMNLEASATPRKSPSFYWSYLCINILSMQRVWYSLFITRGTHQIKLTFAKHLDTTMQHQQKNWAKKKNHSVFCLVFEWCMSSHTEEIKQQETHSQDWSNAKGGKRGWGRRGRIWSHNCSLSDNAYTQRSHVKVFFIHP